MFLESSLLSVKATLRIVFVKHVSPLTDCCQLLLGEPYYLGSVRHNPGGVPPGPPAGDGLQRGGLQPVPQAVQAGLWLSLPLCS